MGREVVTYEFEVVFVGGVLNVSWVLVEGAGNIPFQAAYLTSVDAPSSEDRAIDFRTKTENRFKSDDELARSASPSRAHMDASYNCSSCQGNWSVDSPLAVPSPGCDSIQSAIDCAPDAGQLSDGRLVIHVKPGIYREKLTVGATKGPLRLQGLSTTSDGVIIGWNDADQLPGVGRPGCRGASRTQGNAGGDWDSQTLRVESDDFVLANITVLNDACGFQGGARNFALMTLGDRIELSHCRIYGQHDTFFTGQHRVFVQDTYINGSVDFIFGSGSAVFDRCVIVANGGHITAHKGSATDRDGNSASCGTSSCTAYLIRNSRLPATRHKKAADLGRAWRSRATVIYESCWMDAHIIPQGWGQTMAGCTPTSESCPNVTFGEFNSSGPGGNRLHRVRWSQQLTAVEMERFTVSKILQGWIPSTLCNSPLPQNGALIKSDDSEASLPPRTLLWDGAFLMQTQAASATNPATAAALAVLRSVATAHLHDGPYSVLDKGFMPPR